MTGGSNADVRCERPGDEGAIARVNDEAFGQRDESRIVDAARRAGHIAVSLVAIDSGTIVGHILFTPVTIESPAPAVSVFGLGPMSVLPAFQRRGIGSVLVQAGLRECARLGCQAVVVIGHPNYYPRFGFQRASTYGLRSQFAVPDDVFMAMELTAGALVGHAGLVRYVPEFGGA